MRCIMSERAALAAACITSRLGGRPAPPHAVMLVLLLRGELRTEADEVASDKRRRDRVQVAAAREVRGKHRVRFELDVPVLLVRRRKRDVGVNRDAGLRKVDPVL